LAIKVEIDSRVLSVTMLGLALFSMFIYIGKRSEHWDGRVWWRYKGIPGKGWI